VNGNGWGCGKNQDAQTGPIQTNNKRIHLSTGGTKEESPISVSGDFNALVLDFRPRAARPI
jgi:hypothetical protein